MSAVAYQVGSCRVEIDEDAREVRTVFADGSVLVGRPVDDAESRARAESLGYGEDIWAMTRHHDLLHSLLAEAEGWSCSHTLFGAAHGWVSSWADREERRVLFIQRSLAAGLDAILAEKVVA